MRQLPLAGIFIGLPHDSTVADVETIQEVIEPDAASSGHNEENHTNGLIADLAWILVLGAIVT